MTDFSVTLNIKKVGDLEALNALNALDKKGRQIIEGVSAATGKAMGDVALAYERGSKGARLSLESIAKEHERTIAASQKAATAAEAASRRQAAAAETAARQQGNAADALARRQGNATLAASRGMEQLIRTSGAASSGLTSIVAQAGQIVGGFGVGGPILGAVGVTTVAIVEMFERTKREMVQAVDDAEKEFKRLAKAGDREAIKARIKELVGGDRFGETDEDVAGIQGARARVKQLEAIIAASGGRKDPASEALARVLGSEGGPNVLPHRAAMAGQELDDLSRFLQKVTPEVVQLQGRLRELNREKKPEDDEKALAKSTSAFEKWFGLQERQVKGLSLAGELSATRIGQLTDEADGWRDLAKTLDVSNPKYERYLALAKAADDLVRKQREMPDTSSRAHEQFSKAFGAHAIVSAHDEAMQGLLGGILPDPKAMATAMRATIANALDLIKNDPFVAEANAIKELGKHLGKMISDGIAGGLVSALDAGFEKAFSGAGAAGFLEGFGKAVLGTLASIVQQMGAALVTFGIAMTLFGEGMKNPFTSGPAAIAAGAALIALGSALKAAVGGRGGAGGSSGSGSTSGYSTPDFLSFGVSTGGSGAATTSSAAPAAMPSVGPNYFFGNDPQLQRKLSEVVNSAAGRGLIPGLAT